MFTVFFSAVADTSMLTCRLAQVLVTEVDILATKFSECLNKIAVSVFIKSNFSMEDF